MISLPLVIGVACAILFYRAAEYERMSPWLWALASFALSVAVSLALERITVVLLAQAGLFVTMWLYNARRPSA